MISAGDRGARAEVRDRKASRRSRPMVPPVVAVAASAGGIPALQVLLKALTPSFPAAILVVMHLSPNHESHLAAVLRHQSSIDVLDAADGMALLPAHAYLATANRHLLLGADGCLHLSSAEAVHFTRPAADVLFQSVARVAGHNAIGVVLSGTGTDGTDGVRHIKEAGGFTIAQDEETSAFWGMPGSAIQSGAVDRVLPIGQIGALLRSLTGDEASASP